MMPLTSHIPKPMAKFRQSTLIGDAIRRICSEIESIHITVGYMGAELARHVIEQGAHSIFNTDGHGNSWWIFNTLMRYVDAPVLVLTCDNVVELDLSSIADEYLRLEEPACMVVPVAPVHGLSGDYIFRDGDVVTELSRDRTSEIYCSGIQVLNPKRILDLVPPAGDFYEVWNRLIVHRQLRCAATYPKAWYAVDTLEQLRSVSEG